MKLNDTAEMIFKSKYARNGETWADACLRVATHVASAEVDEEKKAHFTKMFFHMIYGQYFVPGGRILANAGTGIKSLMNCFVLGVDDSRESIYGTLQKAAEIFAHGGGIGYNFSHVREQGALIRSTEGKASGPLSFASLFDQTGEVIQQASRRGAQMLMLNVDHPDIEAFIDFKSIPNTRNERILEEYDRNLKKYANGVLKGTKYHTVLRKTLLDDQLTHFNISTVIPDAFMISVENDAPWSLVSRLDGSVKKEVSAKELLRKLSKQAWASGDPGIFFRDRVNMDNLMLPTMGEIECTNPCGEVPLYPNEACDLGSINLHKLYDEKTNSVDLSILEEITRLAVRFLDNVQEISTLPLEEINQRCKDLRRLGLGVFGWADLLAELELAYDSPEAFRLAEYLSWAISLFAWLESINLAKEKGAFRLWQEGLNTSIIERTLNSPFSAGKFDMSEMLKDGVRNVSVTSIAPTGSIALLCGTNSSIEPFFALSYRRYITEGVGNIATASVVEINPILFRKLEKLGWTAEQIDAVRKVVLSKGTVQNCAEIPDKLRSAFKTAHDLDWKSHIEMQSRWQKYVSNAVSKTINLPKSATEEDVYNCYVEAWKKDLKGITIYRNGSRSFQILNTGASEQESPE